MSVSIDPKNGVRVRTAKKPGRGLAAVIIVLEFIFSVFLYMSLAERVFVVMPAAASPGVPELVAYQGMLTDTSGNPLGGAGSVYCFRYSMWDSSSGGTQVWPQPALGDTSTTPSNSTTTVTDGVFSDQLGRTDTFGTLDFGADTSGTSTYYLQVQVSTSSPSCATGLETLSPRQQITSDAWSQTAQSVYGNQLRTLIANNTVQIGTGGGVASGTQTLLSLDVVNTGDVIGGSCSQNGTLWYDSTLNKALVCANHLVQPFSNGTSTVNSIGTSGTSTLLFNNIFLSAYANLTLSQNGQTINFSAANPSAGGATLSYFQNLPAIATNTTLVTNVGASSIWVAPFVLPQAISASYFRIPVSMTNVSTNANGYASSLSVTAFSGQRLETDAIVIYTQGVGANSLSLQYYTSTAAYWTMQTIVSQSTSAGFVSASVSVSYNLTYPMSGGQSNFQTTAQSSFASSTSGTYSIASSYTLFTGMKFLDIPFAVSLSPGNYWIGFGKSTSMSSNASAPANLSGASMNFSYMGQGEQSLSVLGDFGVTSNTSVQLMPGLGFWTTNAFNYSTSSMAMSQISASSSMPMPFFELVRSN